LNRRCKCETSEKIRKEARKAQENATGHLFVKAYLILMTREGGVIFAGELETDDGTFELGAGALEIFFRA
jgi:hypothetical protein